MLGLHKEVHYLLGLRSKILLDSCSPTSDAPYLLFGFCAPPAVSETSFIPEGSVVVQQDEKLRTRKLNVDWTSKRLFAKCTSSRLPARLDSW